MTGDTLSESHNPQALIQDLIDENIALRKTLSEVSALGATMMFHTYRADCSHFTEDFLKAVVRIDQTLHCGELNELFQQGIRLAASTPACEMNRFHPSSQPLPTNTKVTP